MIPVMTVSRGRPAAHALSMRGEGVGHVVKFVYIDVSVTGLYPFQVTLMVYNVDASKTDSIALLMTESPHAIH